MHNSCIVSVAALAMKCALLGVGIGCAVAAAAAADAPSLSIMDLLEDPARMPKMFEDYDANEDKKLDVEEIEKLVEDKLTLEDEYCSMSSHGQKRCVKRRLTPRKPRLTDKTGDGMLNYEEMQYSEVSLFLCLDTDKDKRLSLKELNGVRSFFSVDADRFMEEYDEDGNGWLDWEELPKLAAMYAEMDLDTDGFLTGQELYAYLSGDPNLNKNQRKGMAAGMLKSKDKDKDGRLTWWEFRPPPEEKTEPKLEEVHEEL